MIDILLGIVFLVFIPITGIFIEEKNSWLGTAIANAVIIGLYIFLNDIPLWAMIKTNQIMVVKLMGVYLLIGIIWSFFKFGRKASKLDDGDFEPNYGGSIEEKAEARFHSIFKRVPTWIAFWPWVVVWDILSDYLRSFFKWVSDMLKKVYRSMFDITTRAAREKTIRKQEMKK